MKIIFLDLDGTLLADDKTISSDDIRAINECHDNGNLIGYVTSRTNRRINDIIKNLPCDFLGTYDGALVKVIKDDKIISNYTIEKPITFEIIDYYFKQHSCDVFAYFEPFYLMNHTISDSKNQYLMKYSEFSKKSLPDCQRVRCRFINNTVKIFKEFKNVRAFIENNDVVFESSVANKGQAVKNILNYFNISSDDAIAIGDGNADISMLSQCKTRIAMMNAPTNVKEYATFVTTSNNQNGVSNALRWIFEISND